MFNPQFCLVHTLDFGDKWFNVCPDWLYGEYERKIFDSVQWIGKIRMFWEDMEVLADIGHYKNRCSGHYYCYLSE